MNSEARTRILVATAALIVIITFALAGQGIWTGQPFPVSR